MKDSDSLLKKRSRVGSKVLKSTPFILLLLMGIWLLLNRQLVIDTITVWQFRPTADIEQLSKDSAMSQDGRFLYLASRPQLDDKDTFNSNCKVRETQSMILGCYAEGRIYIFNVSDKRINGVKTVTAAHEMLHAAYARLSNGDRERLDKLLSAQFDKVTDRTTLDLIKLYDETELGQRYNEMHSLFATELEDLLPELETYYKKYFSDRHTLVSIYKKYHKVFTDLKNTSDNLQQQLSSQKAAIEKNNYLYDLQVSELDADIKAFNKKASSVNGFSTESEFNNARSELIARQAKLNQLVDLINAMIKKYNQGVEDLNNLGVEIDKLNQSLDSRSETIE